MIDGRWDKAPPDVAATRRLGYFSVSVDMIDYQISYGAQCDECGRWIPEFNGGEQDNKHHAENCSLYDPTKD